MAEKRADTFGRSALIFDMDGTLVDSMPHWRRNIRDTAADYGITPPEDFYSFIKNLTSEQVAYHLVEVYGVKEDPVLLWKRLNRQIEEMYSTSITLKPHAREVLEAYRAQGVPMAILTGTERRMVDLVLERLDIGKYFIGSWSCREAGGPKSTVTPFDFVLAQLGVPREAAAVFEDSLAGAETAAKYDMYSVGVFDETSRHEVERFKAVVNSYIYSLDELLLD